MTDQLLKNDVSRIAIPELRSFLISNGFSSEGKWGRYLERFHLEHGDESYDVIVPTTNAIVDYDDRIRDALADLGRALAESPLKLLRSISVGQYKTFRLKVHPGANISSLPFDEGYALLSNSKSLIKASAVSAFSTSHRKVLRGRNVVAVDKYMERIRLGQSEIGSYIFNLLLPNDENMFDEHEDGQNDDIVLQSLQNNIELASEMSDSKRVAASDRMEKVGMSANFCESLYNIIDWSENVILEVSDTGVTRSGLSYSYAFDRSSLSVLERAAAKLAPEEQPIRKTISGTITRLSEPASRRRGSLDLLTNLDGRRRSVRIVFDQFDRDTIITAFKEKSSRLLSVSGFIRTERNGHLVLEEAEGFDASRRGSLL
jgi:hypothetical protein